nr:MAG TPA: hypothetical protein [Bacteriophage sp.]
MCVTCVTMSVTGGQWKGHAQPRKGVRASVQRVISLTTCLLFSTERR